MDDNTRKTELARRAVAAAESSGLNTERLACCAKGYGVETGPWMGELLALAREAWGSPRLVVIPDMGDWVVRYVGSGALVDDILDTEAEALVAALEAAP